VNTTQIAWRNHYCRRWTRHDKIDVDSNAVVARAVTYRRGGKALDLGAGAGRDAVYLARTGFKVTAIDMTCSGVDRMNTVASEDHLSLAAILGDVSEFEFTRQFDLIVSVLVLNHLSSAAARSLVDRMKSHVRVGGICDSSTRTLVSFEKCSKAGKSWNTQNIMFPCQLESGSLAQLKTRKQN